MTGEDTPHPSGAAAPCEALSPESKERGPALPSVFHTAQCSQGPAASSDVSVPHGTLWNVPCGRSASSRADPSSCYLHCRKLAFPHTVPIRPSLGTRAICSIGQWRAGGGPCAGWMGEQLALPGSLSPSFHHSAQAALHLTAPNSAPHSSRGVTPGRPSLCCRSGFPRPTRSRCHPQLHGERPGATGPPSGAGPTASCGRQGRQEPSPKN